MKTKIDLLDLADSFTVTLSLDIKLTDFQYDKIKEFMIDFGKECADAQIKYSAKHINPSWDTVQNLDETELLKYISNLIENKNYIFDEK